MSHRRTISFITFAISFLVIIFKLAPNWSGSTQAQSDNASPANITAPNIIIPPDVPPEVADLIGPNWLHYYSHATNKQINVSPVYWKLWDLDRNVIEVNHKLISLYYTISVNQKLTDTCEPAVVHDTKGCIYHLEGHEGVVIVTYNNSKKVQFWWDPNIWGPQEAPIPISLGEPSITATPQSNP